MNLGREFVNFWVFWGNFWDNLSLRAKCASTSVAIHTLKSCGFCHFLKDILSKKREKIALCANNSQKIHAFSKMAKANSLPLVDCHAVFSKPLAMTANLRMNSAQNSLKFTKFTPQNSQKFTPKNAAKGSK